MFNQKEIEINRHPLFLRNVAASKPEVAIKVRRNRNSTLVSLLNYKHSIAKS